MSNDLFQIEEMLSPRLVWMKRHGITAFHSPDKSVNVWRAQGVGGVGYGETEEDALTDLAIMAGIDHWAGK